MRVINLNPGQLSKMINQMKASLRIKGDFDPDAIIAELALAPTFINTKGKRLPGGNIMENNVVGFHSPFAGEAPLEQHLEWLVDKFKDKHEILRKIQGHNEVDVFCSATMIDQGGFSLSPKSLSLISDLQIRLEVSLIAFNDYDED